ncbi:MAG: prohibitin family protein [Verrucomicrobiae bacterium]|nr:prohibitin family protein [Verrucomicrobiae bacterium]
MDNAPKNHYAPAGGENPPAPGELEKQARLNRFKKRCRKGSIYIIIGLSVMAALATLLYNSIFYTVEGGHAGVVFRRFHGGTVTDTVRVEGIQIIPPWDTLTIYDVRIQQVEHSFPVISNNGLEVMVTVSIRFQPKVELLGTLHKEVGPDYVRKIVIPEVQSLTRSVFGQYSPEEMYTTKRSLIEQTLQGALGEVGEKYVELDDLLIKAIKLPPTIQAAIEARLVEEQRALEMKFRIDRERQEASRKEIEAVGVSKFQHVVGQTISDQLLQYKGIEAALKLAESPNTKVIVVGGKNGLPVFLDAGGNDSIRLPSGARHSIAPPPGAAAIEKSNRK